MNQSTSPRAKITVGLIGGSLSGKNIVMNNSVTLTNRMIKVLIVGKYTEYYEVICAARDYRLAIWRRTENV